MRIERRETYGADVRGAIVEDPDDRQSPNATSIGRQPTDRDLRPQLSWGSRHRIVCWTRPPRCS